MNIVRVSVIILTSLVISIIYGYWYDLVVLLESVKIMLCIYSMFLIASCYCYCEITVQPSCSLKLYRGQQPVFRRMYLFQVLHRPLQGDSDVLPLSRLTFSPKDDMRKTTKVKMHIAMHTYTLKYVIKETEGNAVTGM